jgi:uncharacterized protein YbjT (DUF2867 family)
MKVVLYGATGTIGQAALRECLLDAGVTEVVVVGRNPCGVTHPKLRELIRSDIADAAPDAAEFADADGCLFCLGVSSAGMSEERYRAVTYDLTLAVAEVAAAANPELTFVYVSGAGTDSTERGRSMWARVKGRTENALLALPLHAYMIRLGFMQPVHGERSRTRLYRIGYAISGPLYPLLRRLFPTQILSSEELARAMLTIVRDGAPTHVLEQRDIVALVR